MEALLRLRPGAGAIVTAALVSAAMIAFSGCSIGSNDTRAADERAIRDNEAQWSKAMAAKDVDAFVSFYADDAVVLPPNAPISTSKGTTRAMLRTIFGAPGFSMSFQPTKVDVARSGDIGYSYGTYTSAMTGPSGNPVNDTGKYVTVYKKQADGKWKAVVDTFNSDLPAPPPEPAPAPVHHAAKAKATKKAHKKH